MSGMCAMYAWKTPIDRGLLERMTHKMCHRGEISGWWEDGSVGLAATTWQSRESRSRQQSQPVSWHDGMYRIAADVRLDYRADLLSRFSDRERQLQYCSDSEHIAASYGQWGEACVEYLEGDYAFVLWDRQRQRLFGARSVMGLRPFVYHLTGQRFLCASEPVQLFEDSTVSKALNAEWVAFWLTQGQGHWDGTIYRDIQVLPPGHLLIVDREGIRIKPFWHPTTHPRLHFSRQEEYTEQFRLLLTDAVRTRIQDQRKLCFDLSGGLDSSSLVCLAGELWEKEKKELPLSCFHAQSDEALPYVHATVEKYPVVEVRMLPFQEHLYFDGAFDPSPWMALPCRPTLLLGSFYRQQWAIAAELGVQAHLRGDFGDELLGASLQYLLTYWREHHLGKLFGEVSQWSSVHHIAPRTALEQWVIQPSLQKRSRQEPNAVPWLPTWVQRQAMERLRQDEAYFRKACPDPFARELVQWMHFHTDYTIQGDIALAMAGLETREPYADLRLIEFLLKVPPQYQIRPFQRKFLLREAMQGVLPEIIRQRKGKGHVYQLYFQGIKKHREQLRHIVLHLPELLAPYIDQAPLLDTIDRVALGDQVNVSALSGTLALVLWAHRLPWAGGNMP